MSESGKVPQAGSASATTSRHLSSHELTAAKCTPTRMRLHPQNLPTQLRVRRRDTQPPPTPQQYRCAQAIPDWQGKAAQTPLAIEVRLQRRTWIEQDLSMRPDRILPRPLLHPPPHATLKSSDDGRFHKLAIRQIPDRHRGAPRPIALSTGSGLRQVHVSPPDLRL